MFSKLRARVPSHTTVAAYLSLFLVVTGGTAFALSGSNTVFSDDITNGQVKNSDVGANAIGGGKVGNDSLTGADVRALAGGDVNDNSLTGLDVAESSLGKVPDADKVDGLDSGEFKRSSAYTVARRSLSGAKDYDTDGACEANKRCYLEAACDAGDRIDTGGYYGTTIGTTVTESYPEAAPPTWTVVYQNDGSAEADMHVRAICIDQAPPTHSPG
jgi:hypothetical protein